MPRGQQADCLLSAIVFAPADVDFGADSRALLYTISRLLRLSTLTFQTKQKENLHRFTPEYSQLSKEIRTLSRVQETIYK